MKVLPEIIEDVLSLIFHSISYRNVARHLSETRGLTISHTTILYWQKKSNRILGKWVESIERKKISEGKNP